MKLPTLMSFPTKTMSRRRITGLTVRLAPVRPVTAQIDTQSVSKAGIVEDPTGDLKEGIGALRTADPKQTSQDYNPAHGVNNLRDIGALAKVLQVLRDFRGGKEPTPTSDSTFEEQLLEETRTFLRDIGWPVDAERAERVARIALTVHCKAEAAFNADEAADGDVDVAVSFLLDELHQPDEIVKHTTREAASVVPRLERSEHSRHKGPFEETKITKEDDPTTAHAEDKAAGSADTQNESRLIINDRKEGGVTDPVPNQYLYKMHLPRSKLQITAFGLSMCQKTMTTTQSPMSHNKVHSTCIMKRHLSPVLMRLRCVGTQLKHSRDER